MILCTLVRLALKSEELRTAQAALDAAKTAKEDCERKIVILIENLRKAEREVRPHSLCETYKIVPPNYAGVNAIRPRMLMWEESLHAALKETSLE